MHQKQGIIQRIRDKIQRDFEAKNRQKWEKSEAVRRLEQEHREWKAEQVKWEARREKTDRRGKARQAEWDSYFDQYEQRNAAEARLLPEENRQDRMVVEGVTYNKDMTDLIGVPEDWEGSFVVPDSVRVISYYAFQACTELQTLVLGKHVEVIQGEHAFCDSAGIERLVIPAGDKLIHGLLWNLKELGYLESIEVDPAHTIYASVDGVLYSKDCKRLLRCPIAKKGKIILPDSVEVIEMGAFEQWGGDFSELVLPKGLKKIGPRAFAGVSIARLTVPQSVEYIGEKAFAGCGLKHVTLPAHTLADEDAFSGALWGFQAVTDTGEDITAEYLPKPDLEDIWKGRA